MLPTLTADVTDALPALDRERLAAFDEQIAVLVDAARKQGFPESTVLSMLAAREGLYADRAAAWAQLALYGAPVAAADRLGDDEDAVRAWVRDRLGDAVAAQVAAAVGRHGSLPHFEAWFLARSRSGETPDDLLVRAHPEYTDWLDRQGDAVVDEVMGLMPRDGLRGSVSSAVRTAVAGLQAAAFGAFDERFDSYLRRSVAQVAADEPPTERRGLLHRLVDRARGDTAPAPEDNGGTTGLEYGTLSEFFTVAKAMPDLAGSPDVTRIVGELKAATGLDALEATVLGEAERRLAAVVNRASAFAFLSRFDGDRDGDIEQAPVSSSSDAGGSSVTFTQAAVGDAAWAPVLHGDVARLLEGQISDHAPSRGFVDTLCRECHECLAALAAADDGGTSLDKRVLRRLAQAYHPDAGQDADEIDARSVSRLLELHRAGRLEIRAAGPAVTILTRAPAPAADPAPPGGPGA
jgi:hypothetical protein